jgi:membrane protease YdiL (CAAX protease family)
VRPLRAIAIYLLFVVLGGALLAPWLYELAQWAGDRVPGLRHMAENPFHRFVHRSLLGMAIIGLWPLLRSWGMRFWKDLGWAKPAGQWRRLMLGFGLGWASLALVAVAATLAGARTAEWNVPLASYAQFVAKSLVTAVLVAVLEETLFRGVLFGGLRRSMAWPAALLISSLVYAWVHFFQKPAPPVHIDWASGFVQLAQMMRGFTDLEAMIPGFLSLTLAGGLLALAYQRTGNLFCSIGLHAGWIFWLKAYGFLTHSVSDARMWLWGSDKLIDGWFVTVMLAFAGLGVWFFVEQKEPQHERDT